MFTGFPEHWTTLKKLMFAVGSGIAGGAQAVWKTVTGAFIHITDALASPMQKCEVTIEPVQSGSGDPSPTNVRPITGWTGCNVTHTGKNYSEPNPVSSRGLTLTKNADGSITIDGTATSNGSVTITNKFVAPKSGSVICGWNITGDTNKRLFLWDSTNGADAISEIYTTKTGTVTAGNEYALALYVRKPEPFNNVTIRPFTYYEDEYTIYPISWQTEAGTVYGGTLTVNEDGSCDLSAEWRKESYSSNLSPIASGQSSGFTWCTLEKVLSASRKAYAETPTAGDGNGILNIGVWQRGTAGQTPRAFVTSSLTSLQVVLISDTYDLRTAQGRTDYFANTLNGNNPEVCYKLKTPVIYHLESIAQISTLAGENNIWTDVNGTTTLTYKAVPETAFSDSADTGMADYMTLTE